jgi:hypothetical protein
MISFQGLGRSLKKILKKYFGVSVNMAENLSETWVKIKINGKAPFLLFVPV